MMRSILSALLGGSVLVVLGLAGTAAAAEESPHITGPVSGGAHGWARGLFVPEPERGGLHRSRVFYRRSGESFAPAEHSVLGGDGKWSVRRLAPEPYKTRILVRRPLDPRRFNGTIVVEWLQSQGGYDKDVFWIWAHEEILREGYAWVGVTGDRTAITGLAMPGAITNPPGGSPDSAAAA